MIQGLYELLLDTELQQKITNLSMEYHIQQGTLDGSDSHDYLAQYLGRFIREIMKNMKGKEKERINKQLELSNRIIELLVSHDTGRLLPISDHNFASQLLAVTKPHGAKYLRPDTPLSFGALLTGTRLDPPLMSQIVKEITSCREVDILCSFIKWSGIRIILPALRDFTNQLDSRLRIITTTYMGATDFKALKALSNLPNTEVRISYDERRTRLHAKAYILKRDTGFSAAYIGSSNFSKAAMTDGLEWNVKVSQYEQPYLWDKIRASFDTYWNDQEFEPFGDGAKFKKALETSSPKEQRTFFFDLRPYPFQQEILDILRGERVLHGRKTHLIVAATGTGKTIIAAFDFRSWKEEFRKQYKREPKLLFIAHREEILKQSLEVFRGVLKDNNFGELLVGGTDPQRYEHLFCSIQSYQSKKLSRMFPKQYFDYVVVDEFHRAAASTYQDLLDHVRPSCLIGLTATPERHDEKDIFSRFDHHISAEIRLPDAISRNLLCPFQYFGITDNIDYTQVSWKRGGYDISELKNILDADEVRAGLIASKVKEILLDASSARGLGFCVSQEHARFMAANFNRFGIPSICLTALSPKEERESARRKLSSRDVNFIFTVDLYNEGVDIPEVDTVLFLRPTESLTVFLQQLGRGLRLSDGKDCLTVLDFIGRSHVKFRFDLRFTSLLKKRTGRIQEEIESGFPHLPTGCSIQLERVAQDHILETISRSFTSTRKALIRNIREVYEQHTEIFTLQQFINKYPDSLHEIYKKDLFARLCVEAGIREDFHEPDEVIISKRLSRILHLDDFAYICRLIELLSARDLDRISETDELYLTMFLTMLYREQKKRTPKATVFQLRKNRVIHDEIIDVLKLLREQTQVISPDYSLPGLCPLSIHASYTLSEILASFGYTSWNSNKSFREGVLYLSNIDTDIFFVTLNKNQHQYSPTTMYEDYAVDERLFHWQSQGSAANDSPTAKRYRKPDHRILLFVREEKITDGIAQPYCFLGPAEYQSDEGSRPVSFLWKMRFPIPAAFLRKARKLSVG